MEQQGQRPAPGDPPSLPHLRRPPPPPPLVQAILLARYPGLATPEAMAGLASILYTPGALQAAGNQVRPSHLATIT